VPQQHGIQPPLHPTAVSGRGDLTGAEAADPVPARPVG